MLTYKCYVMHITQLSYISYNLLEDSLNVAKSEQIYLSATIQSNLKWKSHVLNIIASGVATVGPSGAMAPPSASVAPPSANQFIT